MPPRPTRLVLVLGICPLALRGWCCWTAGMGAAPIPARRAVPPGGSRLLPRHPLPQPIAGALTGPGPGHCRQQPGVQRPRRPLPGVPAAPFSAEGSTRTL
eukprot:486166-Prorocentrum_minimum.AAC.1